MAYLDVITLTQAKSYLRVDDGLTADDENITRMIKSALAYVENFTDILVYARDIPVLLKDSSARVYKYPINSEVTADLTKTYHPLYTTFCTDDIDLDYITLNLGYTLPADVPTQLLDAAYEVIDLLYYGKETGRTMQDLSAFTIDSLNQNKRFLI